MTDSATRAWAACAISADVSNVVIEHPAKRYFTVTEANDLVPELRELFGRVLQLRSQLKSLYQQLDDAGFAPTSNDEGDDETEDMPPDVARNRALFYGMAQTLREQIENILATGCVIKDIETGLCDWPALHQGREIWLCWKYGELRVEYWHELRTGFAGRRPVAELEPVSTE